MFKKILVIFLTLGFLSNIAVQAFSVRGADVTNSCEVVEESFKVSDLIFGGINVQRTVGNTMLSIGTAGIAGTEGANVNDIIGCEEAVISAVRREGFTGFANTVCRDTDPSTCNELMNRTSADTVGGGIGGLTTRQLAVRGSLLGAAFQLEELTYEEPLAINFAYFWNRNVEKLPIVGRTFAASGYNMPMLDAAYGLWELVRNVSLALMSVILLYTGLMIIMRKKVNPQLVVSVQYAIPKIIIGLLLIIFSYPIGAAIIGVSWGLYRGSSSIVLAQYPLISGNGIGALYLAIAVGILKTSVGWGGIVVLLLVMLCMTILSIVVYIKAALIYLKMVLAVITAPFEMALGTVPGSEGKIMDWFKRMAKYGITIFAMGVSIPVIVILAFEVLMSYRTGGAPETAGFGSLLRVLVPPMVVIYGFTLALGMEKTVGSFFGDDKKNFKK